MQPAAPGRLFHSTLSHHEGTRFRSYSHFRSPGVSLKVGLKVGGVVCHPANTRPAPSSVNNSSALCNIANDFGDQICDTRFTAESHSAVLLPEAASADKVGANSGSDFKSMR